MKVFKGRTTREFSYPVDEDFFDEVPCGADAEFGEDDVMSESEACTRECSDQENDNEEHSAFDDGSWKHCYPLLTDWRLGAALRV